MGFDTSLPTMNQTALAITQVGRAASPLAHQAIHDTVIQLLDALPRGKLLDVPAGEGALAARLIHLGFDVHCCDLYPQIFRLQGIEIKGGDLTSTLPYGEGEFDYITCVEGLEHLENPQQAIREFRRLLRVGGHLIVTVPNILNIEERLKWLLYGYTSHFRPLSREYLDTLPVGIVEMEEIALHVHPIGYAELRYILEKNDFEIRKLYRDKPKRHIWAYWPIAGLIRLLARLTSERKRRERWAEELQSDEVLLGGNTLIVETVKGVSR